tara:strand:+ start:242 stop:682 length:441 start_codon:yes stop_codon:yes gene_type:complete
MTSWREKQKAFIPGEVELLQDQRILDFFGKLPVYCMGDVDYFQDKLNFVEKPVHQALAIINEETSDRELVQLLHPIKKIDRVCVSINKFLIYTNSNNKQVDDDHDTALLHFIENIFEGRRIDHYFVKGLKGHHFNFASPTTQFFIE